MGDEGAETPGEGKERRREVKYFIIAAALAIAGCEEPPGVKKHVEPINYIVRTLEIKGHEYIIFEGCNKGNIIHSESCPCKKGGAK